MKQWPQSEGQVCLDPRPLSEVVKGKEGVGRSYILYSSQSSASFSFPSFLLAPRLLPKVPSILALSASQRPPRSVLSGVSAQNHKIKSLLFPSLFLTPNSSSLKEAKPDTGRKHVIELIYTKALVFLSKKQLSRIIQAGVSSLNVISGMLLQITIPWNTSLGLKLTVMVAQ